MFRAPSRPSSGAYNCINPLNSELNSICHLLELLANLKFMGPCIVNIFQYIYPTRCNVTHFIHNWKLLYMFRVVLPPIIGSSYNYIHSIWYLSHRYCYLPLSWKSWNRFECAVGLVFIAMVESVFSAVRTDSLYKADCV
jgi:hypothetical protein